MTLTFINFYKPKNLPSNCEKTVLGNSISELQIQVATYIFELSAGNCHRQMAALSIFIVMHNDRYARDCKDGAAVTRWQRPQIRVPR